MDCFQIFFSAQTESETEMPVGIHFFFHSGVIKVAVDKEMGRINENKYGHIYIWLRLMRVPYQVCRVSQYLLNMTIIRIAVTAMSHYNKHCYSTQNYITKMQKLVKTKPGRYWGFECWIKQLKKPKPNDLPTVQHWINLLLDSMPKRLIYEGQKRKYKKCTEIYMNNSNGRKIHLSASVLWDHIA